MHRSALAVATEGEARPLGPVLLAHPSTEPVPFGFLGLRVNRCLATGLNVGLRGSATHPPPAQNTDADGAFCLISAWLTRRCKAGGIGHPDPDKAYTRSDEDTILSTRTRLNIHAPSQLLACGTTPWHGSPDAVRASDFPVS